MIRGKEIVALVDLLETRSASLFHACQFTDFEAYLKLGGIPARAYLEHLQASFTLFETDYRDHVNGVWDKVFVNLSDFGQPFARGSRCVPNPFGPIVLQIRPSALLEANDVAVCLRSAGALNFDREQDSLSYIEEIDQLFFYAADAGFPESTFVKYGEQLHLLGGSASNPEISCAVDSGFLPMDHAIVVWVDPYEIADKELLFWVKAAISHYDMEIPAWIRYCREDRLPFYEELLLAAHPTTQHLREIQSSECFSDRLKAWGEDILAIGLDYQFQRYARYLREGTIQPLLDRA